MYLGTQDNTILERKKQRQSSQYVYSARTMKASSSIRNKKGRNKRGMQGGSLLCTLLLMVSAVRRAHSLSIPSHHVQWLPTNHRKSWNPTSITTRGCGRRSQHGRRRRSIPTTSLVLDSTTRQYDYDPYQTANKIEPQTPTISESLLFYGKFLVKHFHQNSRKNTTKRERRTRIQRLLRRHDTPHANEKEKEKATAKEENNNTLWQQMNEQRKNIMTLAGYTASFVVPSFGFLLLGAFMTSIVPSYWGKCIQCVATLEATQGQLVEALIGLGVSSILAGLFTGIRGSLFWIGGCRANYNIRVKLHRSLLLQEAAFFDTNETGYLLSRLNSDVNKIGQVISYHINVVLRQSAQFIFGSMYLLRISPRLSLYAFAGIILVAVLSAVYGDLARDLAEKVQDTFADATAVAETSFTMSETIRAFDGVDIESDKFEAAQFSALELEEVQAWAYGSHKFLSDTLQSVLQVLLLVACWGVGKAGGLPAKELTTFMFYTGFVLESSNEVGDQWAKIQQAIGASSSVFELIKRAPSVRDPLPNEIADKVARSAAIEVKPATEKPVIAIEDVTLEYDAMERPALSQITTKIYSGDRVALVGRSGSGKSSMLRTMLRFYDPSKGVIELDGKDLKSLTRAETASLISLVEQEPHVFPMTLMQNVVYGIEKDDVDPQTDEAAYNPRWRTLVSECLKLAGLPVFPGNELGLELDTRIGEGGRSLSGGQRQRVAIARAIIRSPQVLLLDEPTSALDSESEKKVVQSLQTAMEQIKSMVMVTHRLGVIRALDVNRVIVLDKGKIVEEGHPEDLLRDDESLYAGLAREQGITKSEKDEELTHKV